MVWTIKYDESVLKTLSKMDKPVAKRILEFMTKRVAVLENPRAIGEALRGDRLGEYWKYRAGDYRIITRIEDNVMSVMVVKVGNRREVYKSK